MLIYGWIDQLIMFQIVEKSMNGSPIYEKP